MKDRVIVFGSGDTLSEDLKQLPGQIKDYDFIAVGQDSLCEDILPISYVATYHIEDIPEIKKRMAFLFPSKQFKIISHIQSKLKEVDIIILFEKPSGSSALLAVLAAIKIGYKKIIVIGCPLEGKSSTKHQNYKIFREGWVTKLSIIKNYTRAVSGYLSEILGKPDKEWLGKE